jgi:hypothetical protein
MATQNTKPVSQAVEDESEAIAALERKIAEAKSDIAKKALKEKLERLKQEAQDSDVEANKLAMVLLKQRKRIKELAQKDFDALIRRLAKKSEYSFLKNYTREEIIRDMSLKAKPVGWRFKGKNKYKIPSKKQVTEGVKNGTVYYENRPKRSDVSFPAQLGKGGGLGNSLEEMSRNAEAIRTSVKMKFAIELGIDKALALLNRDWAVSPYNLLSSAVLKGFITLDDIDKKLVNEAINEAEDVDNDYKDSGEGIGSSDMNAFIRNMLKAANIEERKMAKGGEVGENEMTDKEVKLYEQGNYIHYNPMNSRWEVRLNGKIKEFWNQDQAEKFAGFEYNQDADSRYSRNKYNSLFGYAKGGEVGDNKNTSYVTWGRNVYFVEWEGKYPSEKNVIISDMKGNKISGILFDALWIKFEKSYKYAKGGEVGDSKLQRKVDEVNRLIKLVNDNDLTVVNSSSTWETPMKYQPIVVSRGGLKITYKELDLYKYNRTGKQSWEEKKETVLKRDMEFDNPLNDIAKWHRKVLRENDIMFEDGGEIKTPIIRTQFEEEEYEYGNGGNASEPHRLEKMAKGGGIYYAGAELSNYDLELIQGQTQSKGVSIKQMRQILKSQFPDSFGFTLHSAKNNEDLKFLKPDDNNYNGIDDESIKIYFDKYHGIDYRVYQGGENTYFYFLLISNKNTAYIGQFGFKDEGEVPKEYVTSFISFLQTAYGQPFKIHQSVQ